MCGIAGYINLNGLKACEEVVRSMTNAIKHRGPDAEGIWIEGNVGIGHRRLSIIDLSTLGQQPMLSADHRYVLSYNGEIYNYIELKLELESFGYWFRSNSDTEVVLNAFIHWGKDSVKKFNGMFAISIWDRKEKKLFLARDRYGVKPLYYSVNGCCFAFGSEQKALMESPEFKIKINKQVLVEYFTFQNIFTDQTFIENTKLLPAGSYATLDTTKKVSQNLEIITFWDYNFIEPEQVEVKKDEYVEELDRLFKQAVKRQLVGDVELGAYLSGGMDSGSITAIASKHFPNLKSFTCGFDLSSASGIELGFDERIRAEAMSARFKTEHYEIVLKSGDMERCFPKLVWHLEEPRVGQSYPNYYAAKLAGKFVKVVLSGSGGDELFGGYPWRYYRSATANNFEEFVSQYYSYWQRLMSSSEIEALFKPIWKDVKDVNTRYIFSDVFRNQDKQLNRPEDYINHSLYFEAKTFLHGLFIVEDKLSMAHSLENRVPFMDNDLVDFAMKCPIGFKLNNLSSVIKINENEHGNKTDKYFQKTNDGKQILRNLMTKYIPSEITKYEKQGFSSPDASWFKGESIEFVKRKLLSNKAEIYEYLDKNMVHQMVHQHLSGNKNRRLLIWSLLNFEELLKQYKMEN